MKWRQLVVLAVEQWLAMALWFSASAVNGALKEEWSLSPTAVSWLTISVQLGFVIGALASAMLNLSDRIKATCLLAACAILGAVVNLIIPFAITNELGKTAGG